MNTIKLNKDVAINLPTLVESRLLIQANSGGGKSWVIRRLLEQSHGQIQQIVIDLEGEFSTLREKYDYVLAGKGGDTPADPRSAALLARKLLELKVSAIIDLYELNHMDRKRFVRLFLNEMVNAPKELQHPCLVVIDEAHVFCPEKGQAESAEAVIDIATRGRKRGFAVILATQRLSKLHKDAAAECNNKLIGRTTLDIDMKRAYDELGFNSKEQYASLRKLEAGEFFAFGPAISSEVIKTKVGDVRTTHPKAGDRFKAINVAPTAKIKALLPKLSDLPAEAQKEAETLANLKSEIVQLKRQNASKTAVIDPKLYISKQEMERAIKEIEKNFFVERGQWQKQIENWFKILKDIGQASNKALEDYKKKEFNIPKPTVVSIPKDILQNARGPQYNIKPGQLVSMKPIDSELGQGERKVLIAAAQQMPNGISREHLTIVTGYKRSTRDAYIQRLTQRGLIAVNNGVVHPTEEGIEKLGTDYEPLPTGEDLRLHLMGTLPEGEKKILAVLIASYPESTTRDDLSETTGFKRSTRDAYLQRLTARQLITTDSNGARAVDKLFE